MGGHIQVRQNAGAPSHRQTGGGERNGTDNEMATCNSNDLGVALDSISKDAC